MLNSKIVLSEYEYTRCLNEFIDFFNTQLISEMRR